MTGIRIPEGITEIGEGAFSVCTALVSVTLPSTLRRIESYAFSACAELIEIRIPLSVEHIGNDAFWSCESLTVYCEASEQPRGFSMYWNRSLCPVVWGKRFM